MRLAVLVVVLASVAVLTYLLLAGSLLGIRSVAVTGTAVLTDDQVREAAAVPVGRPMLWLDAAAIAERVGTLAAVAQVRVERSWPSAVVVHVTERVPVAFEPTGTGARLVDGGGMFFATVPSPPPGLPELHAADGAPAQAAATVITTLAGPAHQALRAELVAVSADSPADVRLRLRGDRAVRWGSATDSDRKAAVLAVLLSQPGQTYDVASPDLPTIR
jgi:cell division protein FtsQ